MIATYRLQLDASLDFDRARELLPYLRRLGVSHLYLSPITEARAGSTHGYDVIDHNEVRAELGGEEGFERLRRACVEAGLEILLDFVPNHAGVGPDNEAWQDVLAYGRHSPHARRFDLDWSPLKPELKGKLLLPFLGSPYGEALDGGQLHIVYERGRLFCAYFEHRFALAPESYGAILARVKGPWAGELAAELRDLSPGAPGGRDAAEALRERLADCPEEEIARAAGEFEGEALHQLLEHQRWRLSYWKTAGYEINYRRFFDINELVGLRMEDEQVFSDTHRLLGDLLRREGVRGVRIDHIDGLYDPDHYLERLSSLGRLGDAGIWVEKILAHGEVPPESWPIEGTTGYEFLNGVLHLLLPPEAELSIERTYHRFVKEEAAFGDVLYRSKQVVIATRLAGELFRLAYELDRLSEADYRTRDFTLEALREALAEVVACFPRYRTYLPRHAGEEAAEVILEAVYEARRRNPAFEPTVFDFVGRALLEPMRPELEPARRAWVARLQQYTAPVSAKGEEDTAFYRYVRFVAVNEVGGDPERFGQGTEVFHSHARFRVHRYPHALLCTATHDNKRGEDTRMRLLALAELPERWAAVVRSLRAAVRRHRGEFGPSAGDAYLLLQTLIALWGSAPEEEIIERVSAYAVKAAREAKLESSWVAPSEEYEGDLGRFVSGMVRDRRVGRIVAPFAGEVARIGFLCGISQLLLKLTAPGIPDIYRGAELLDLSLVDPDNRRPVDFKARARMLDELEPLLEAPDPEALKALADSCDPRFKLYLIARLLRFRQSRPELFAGTHRPLEPTGPAADATVAFSRESERGEAAVAVVPRFFAATSEEARRDTEIKLVKARPLTEVLTGTQLDPSKGCASATSPCPGPSLLLTSPASRRISRPARRSRPDTAARSPRTARRDGER